MAQRKNEALRYRYGKCLNENCEKGKSKEVIQIPARKDFVCPDCGKSLRECPPPKKPFNWMLYGGMGIAAAAVITGLVLFVNKSDDNTPATSSSPISQQTGLSASNDNDSTHIATLQPTGTDSVNNSAVNEKNTQKKDTPKENVNQSHSQESSGTPYAQKTSATLSLPYGRYKGEVRNGKPHGQGTLTYSTQTLIDSRDSKQRHAEAGEYIIGEWDNGRLVQGRWFKNDNTKEVIILGKAG